MRPIVDRLVAKNYGCLKDVDVRLTPLHCFIGPNDSGKSTLLRAVKVLSSYMERGSSAKELQAADVSDNDDGLYLCAESERHFYSISSTPPKGPDEKYGHVVSDSRGPRVHNVVGRGGIQPRALHPIDGQFCDFLATARLIRLDPQTLATSSSLIPDNQPLDFYSEHGAGLAGIYDALMNRDVEGFLEVVARVRKLFPTVSKIQLRNTSTTSKRLEIELNDGRRVSVDRISTGLLYFLAYSAIPYLDPCSILLIEEPENGLHPARIAEVMSILREVSKNTQVLIATHSPLVVNELQPEEVSIVTREPEAGTKVTPLVDTPNFEARSKVYALGELWVSYANGDDEGPLLNPPSSEQE